MRVLLYNYVQPQEPGAGGVGVYLDNLSRALADHGHDVILMSSGDRYDLVRRKPRVAFSRDRFDRAVIHNAPMIAPAAFAFAAPDAYTDSGALDFVPERLARRYGRIDVFHFHNIEGLTRSFFDALRRRFPDARVLFSAHNYSPVCLRTTLWYQDRLACEDYRDGAACTMCYAKVFDAEAIKDWRRLARIKAAARSYLKRPTALAARAWQRLKPARTYLPTSDMPDVGPRGGDVPTSPAPATAYARYRTSNIALLARVFDTVLAVSARTRDVLVGRGVSPERIAVSYIGTAHKATFLRSTRVQDHGGTLHLGYIGYMTRDKGFHFLIDCLERMPDAVAAGIAVTIAARNADVQAHARMLAAGKRFAAFRYFDGFTHATLDQVLDGVNLGLIPVLWEDNLPQTAIELVSRGIPILTSDRGGAQEIAHDPLFTFRAGDGEALIDRLARIARHDIPLGAFWAGDIRIFSMDEHVEDLMRHYAPGNLSHSAARQLS